MATPAATTSSVPLPGLPGAAEDPGSGPAPAALFADLIDDAAPTGAHPPEAADVLATHREHRASWYAELIGHLRLRADQVPTVVGALSTREHGLRTMIVAGAPDTPDTSPSAADTAAQEATFVAALEEVRAARHHLLDDDRLDVVGIELAVPALGEPAETMHAVLGTLDFSTPAWLVVPDLPGWEAALTVLAEDGAEHLALRPAGVRPFDTPEALGRLVRHVVDRDLTFSASVVAPRVVAAVGTQGPGLLNLLCAVRAALSGADEGQIAAILAETREATLTSAVRAMSEADAAVVRVFLASVGCLDPRAIIDDLRRLGLVEAG